MQKGMLLLVPALLLFGATPEKGTTAAPDWKGVAAAIGRAGTLLPGDVYKVSFPRSDLAVTVRGIRVRPALALGSWAAFKETGGGEAMTMGDLVLLEPEVNAVLDALQKGGIEESAVHTHLIEESPHVMYVHFEGHGDATRLAATLRAALAMTKTPTGPPAPPATTTAIDLPTADLDRIIGHPGKVVGGTYQFSVPRAEKVTAHAVEIPPAMGTAIAMNFQPTGKGRAAITGDFVLIATEVNPVIRVLRAGGVGVTALHNHMLDETPRLFFMHFWANDDARKLAGTLRSALNEINVMK